MICCWPSNSALNVWKNSSCERSLPAKNWMSSISSASSERYDGFELVDGVVLERLDHVADETLGVHVRDARALVAAADHVADRVHQVRLAQPDAAVDEQRVVRAAGILSDLHRRCARQLVALALDEARESEVRIEPAAEHRGQFLDCAHDRSGERLRPPPPARRASRLRARPPAPARSRRASTSSEIRPATFSFTQSTTNRFGASRRRVCPSSTACSGRIQVLNCASGSSASS